jgi:release factor glutamine methyltransferase
VTTVAEALREAARRLGAVSDTARLDAELLMAHSLGVSRSDLLLRHTRDAATIEFEALIERRERHEPVAYITGSQEFYGLDLEVTPAVLIPRADSEALIEAAREALADRAPRRILDLGTGSGALLLAALTVWPEAAGMGIERDFNALLVAMRNAERVGVNVPPDPAELERERARLAELGIIYPSAVGYAGGRARFNGSDWSKRGWAKHLGQFDLILANPPYVEHDAQLESSVRDWEPAAALFAGPEGLDDYLILIRQLPKLLTEDGVAIFEIGATQADAVARIAAKSGFASELRRDLAGRPRALVLRRSCD